MKEKLFRNFAEAIEKKLLTEMQKLFSNFADESKFVVNWYNGDWVIVVRNLHCPDEGDTCFMVSVSNKCWNKLWFSNSLSMFYDRSGKLTPFDDNVKEMSVAIVNLIISIDQYHIADFEKLMKSGLLLKKSLDYEID